MAACSDEPQGSRAPIYTCKLRGHVHALAHRRAGASTACVVWFMEPGTAVVMVVRSLFACGG